MWEPPEVFLSSVAALRITRNYFSYKFNRCCKGLAAILQHRKNTKNTWSLIARRVYSHSRVDNLLSDNGDAVPAIIRPESRVQCEGYTTGARGAAFETLV